MSPDTDTLREQIARLIGYNFASLVSRNNMPDMSGDPRKRIPAHERRHFDDACEITADAIMALLPSLPDGWVAAKERLEALADAYEPGRYALADGVCHVYYDVPECCQTLRDDLRIAVSAMLSARPTNGGDQ